MAMSGSVLQSKQIQFSKAASIFTRFAATSTAGAGAIGVSEHAKAADAGARSVAEHAKAAYLRLASTAFGELLEIRKELGVVEKARKKKKRGRSRDESTRSEEEEEESDDGGEVVDSKSDMKRRRMEN